MRLRRLQLDQFRRFDQPVEVRGIADGLNLIAGPNEMGKSTLLAALNAVLFEKHGSRSRQVAELRPHRHDVGPWVALDFELAGAPYRIEKRFWKRPQACLHLPGGRRVEGDAAEEELRGLLGLLPAGGRSQAAGLWQLLLVGQGQSFTQPQVDPAARPRLQEALEAELGSLTGSESANAMIGRIDSLLHALIDRRGGRPKGRYRQVEDGLAAARAGILRLQREREALTADLADLEGTQAALRDLGPPDAGGEETALAQLEARRDALHRSRLVAAEAAATLERARRELAEAQAQEGARRALVEACAAALRRRDEADAAALVAAEALAAREAEGNARRREHERLAADHELAARRLRLLEALAGALRGRERADAALGDASPEVRLEIAAAALARVRLDGQPLLRPVLERRIAAPLAVEIDGIGRIAVAPPAGLAGLRTEVARLEGEIVGLLQELGLGGEPGEAVARLPALAVVERALGRARTLVGQLARQRDAAAAGLEAAREAWREERLAGDAAQAHLRAGAADLLDLEQRLLAARAGIDDAALAARLDACRAALAAAETAVAAVGPVDAAELLTLERALEEQSRARDGRRLRRHELEKRLVGLIERVGLREGMGLIEQIEEQRRVEAGLEQERQALSHEVQVLTLLRAALEEAEHEASDRYLAPLLARLRPHLETLLPGAGVLMDEDFQIRSVRRATGDEPFEQISHGTREQIAVLARIACAELLAEQGLPAVLVLDDALAFADDQRLERLFVVLERVAAKLQIIVLTCRERVFQELQATRLRIEEPALAT